MTWTPLIASLSLTAVDVIVTRRRLPWELNPLVKILCGRLQLPQTLLVVLALSPQVLWAILLSRYLPSGLMVFVGAQLHRTYWQIRSLKPLIPRVGCEVPALASPEHRGAAIA